MQFLYGSVIFFSVMSGAFGNAIFEKKSRVLSLYFYPKTEKSVVKNTYFDRVVEDPYQWLENIASPDTVHWVNQQSQFSQQYFSQVAYRNAIKSRLTAMVDYERIGAPFTVGEYQYFYKNTGLQDHYVLWRKTLAGKEEEFLNPNHWQFGAEALFTGISFSKDGSLAAISLSRCGSDYQEIYFMDTQSRQFLDDQLKGVRFSSMRWVGNKGIYYSRYSSKNQDEPSPAMAHHQVYFHHLHTQQEKDELVFGGSEDQRFKWVGAGTTEDEKFLIIYASDKSSENTLFIKKIDDPVSGFIALTPGISALTQIVANEGDILYLQTTHEAPNEKLVKVDYKTPYPSVWVDVIPEGAYRLKATSGGGYLFAHYREIGVSKQYQYRFDGQFIREVPLPDHVSSEGIWGRSADKTLYYHYTNYFTPGTTLSYQVETGEVAVYHELRSTFKSDDYQSEQVFYPSKDGTQVPMIITYKKGLVLNGRNPTLLTGYGGFDHLMMPHFDTDFAWWLEQEGVLAVPNIRGGGELGKNWHRSAIGMHREKCFDDFIAAAEYLIDEKYTSPQYLAVMGQSNGGLLVGVAMTKRPELFAVAIAGVGLFDMLRYHQFNASILWKDEYGTSEDSPEMFCYLQSYSPYHNIVAHKAYPATLIVTADHDDRVTPAHSYKYVARLQEKQSGDQPILILINRKLGHGQGMTLSQSLDNGANILSFMIDNMGRESCR